MNWFKETVNKVLPKSQFARAVSVLVGGTAGAQVMMVLAAPLLTRLYSPEDFGLLGVYVGLLALFTVIACLRYELAIPLPEHDQEAANIVVLCLLTVLGITSASALLVWLAGDAITQALGVPSLASYFWLLPVGVLLVGTYQTFNYWAIRTKQFPTIARTRIWQAFTTIGIQLSAFKTGGLALLLGQTGGQGMGSITLMRAAMARPEFRAWSWRGVRCAAKRYRRFPIYDIWYGLFFTVGAQLPIILFASLFSPAIAGFYALANRVLAMPIGVVGGAIANVFLSGAAAAQRENKLGILFEKLVSKLIYLAMPPALVLLIAGPELFSVVFGQNWETAGAFARMMSVWIFMQFITAPLTTLFTVMEKQAHGALFQALMLVIRISALIVGFLLESFVVAVFLFSVGSAIGYLAMLVWMAINSKASIHKMMQVGLLSLTISCFSVSPLLAFQWFGWGGEGLIFCGVLAGGLILAQYAYLLKKVY